MFVTRFSFPEVKDEKARAEPVAAEPEPLRSEHAHNVKGRREKKQERDHVVEAFYEPKSNTSVKEEQLKSVDQVEKKVHVKMSEGLNSLHMNVSSAWID